MESNENNFFIIIIQENSLDIKGSASLSLKGDEEFLLNVLSLQTVLLHDGDKHVSVIIQLSLGNYMISDHCLIFNN